MCGAASRFWKAATSKSTMTAAHFNSAAGRNYDIVREINIAAYYYIKDHYYLIMVKLLVGQAVYRAGCRVVLIGCGKVVGRC